MPHDVCTRELLAADADVHTVDKESNKDYDITNKFTPVHIHILF